MNRSTAIKKANIVEFSLRGYTQELIEKHWGIEIKNKVHAQRAELLRLITVFNLTPASYRSSFTKEEYSEILEKLRTPKKKIMTEQQTAKMKEKSAFTFVNFLKRNGYEIKQKNPNHVPGQGYSPAPYYSNINLPHVIKEFAGDD